MYFYSDILKNLDFLQFYTRQPGGGITGSRGHLKPLIRRISAGSPIADSSTQQPHKLHFPTIFFNLKSPQNSPKITQNTPIFHQNNRKTTRFHSKINQFCKIDYLSHSRPTSSSRPPILHTSASLSMHSDAYYILISCY